MSVNKSEICKDEVVSSSVLRQADVPVFFKESIFDLKLLFFQREVYTVLNKPVDLLSSTFDKFFEENASLLKNALDEDYNELSVLIDLFEKLSPKILSPDMLLKSFLLFRHRYSVKDSAFYLNMFLNFDFDGDIRLLKNIFSICDLNSEMQYAFVEFMRYGGVERVRALVLASSIYGTDMKKFKLAFNVISTSDPATLFCVNDDILKYLDFGAYS